jgi:drug/metabolite transporter (DMT)-like permease
VLTVLFAWAILDESPSPLQLGGVALVVCGLLIVTWGSRPRRQPAEPGYVPAGPRESLGS